MPIFNKPNSPDQPNDLAAQLRAAQQQNPVRPAAPAPQPAPPKDPYQEKMDRMEAAMKARQAQQKATQSANQEQPQSSAQKQPQQVQPQRVQPQRAVQPQAPINAKQQDISDLLAKEAAVAKAKEEAQKAREAAQAVQVKAIKELQTEEEKPVEAQKPAAPANSLTLRESLKALVGQTVRIQTADHESASGRLEVVAEDWIKLVNMRSAGTEYFADEDIISIPLIVKVRSARPVDKETYNDFMGYSKA